MDIHVPVNIEPQPDDFTCGPTCLHAIYNFYQDAIALDQVIAETSQFEEGGTLAVLLGCHALQRGYRARIYTYDLEVFDPTWFMRPDVDLHERLEQRLEHVKTSKLRHTIPAYMEFVERGGELRFEDLTTGLIRKHLSRSIPILTGLSATFLYRSPREYGPQAQYDDLRGEPQGHFVVLCGYYREKRTVLIADPFQSNPFLRGHVYEINIDRVICAILLGVLTYDANLLIIKPPIQARCKSHASAHRR